MTASAGAAAATQERAGQLARVFTYQEPAGPTRGVALPVRSCRSLSPAGTRRTACDLRRSPAHSSRAQTGADARRYAPARLRSAGDHPCALLPTPSGTRSRRPLRTVAQPEPACVMHPSSVASTERQPRARASTSASGYSTTNPPTSKTPERPYSRPGARAGRAQAYGHDIHTAGSKPD